MQQSRAQIASLSVLTLLALASVACATEPAVASGDSASVAAQLFVDEAGPEGVRNYTRVDTTIACAGATPPDVMAYLKERGFVSIINFRTDGERGETNAAGQAAAEAAGLKYFHLPFRAPSAEVTEAFLETVTDPANQPVYIHCGSANRVGAMWLIKRVKVDGWSVEDATTEAEAIGLRSAGLKEFALEYVGGGR
jgi:uncharacterized protein (TIGR01244 family)